MMRSLLALAAACVAAAAVPASAQTAAVYTAKDTTVGSVIPQTIVTANVPFDRTWAQLTPDQQAVVASDYESLAAGDEPPYPARGLASFKRYLVRAAERTEATGPLVAAVDVSPEGRARGVTVYRAPDPEIAKFAAAMLMNEDFKPAKCNGAPCAMQYVLRVGFPERHGAPVTTTTRLDTLRQYSNRF